MTASAWQPHASLAVLRQRAALLQRIRNFFVQRGIVEVETPQLLTGCAPELHQEPINCQRWFLQTSPEMAMKRLLAAGMGPIYQICRAFRADECGQLHNPEFTILEWYRPGWSYGQLMEEVEALLWYVLVPNRSPEAQARNLTFAEAFQQLLGLDPFSATTTELAAACGQKAGQEQKAGQADGSALVSTLDRAEMLDWLTVERLEPGLAKMGGAVFLRDFPPSPSAMAQTDPGPPAVAKRFELYFEGVELANGYQELLDEQEQRQRFVETNQQRQRLGKPLLPIDETFLQALASGLPACSGVALGLDRLIMLAVGVKNIQDVMAFPIGRI